MSNPSIEEKRRWLSRYNYLNQEIKNVNDAIKTLRAQQMLPAMPTKTDPVQGGKLPDPMGNYACKLEELEEKLNDVKCKAVDACCEIVDVINQVPDERYKSILQQRYLLNRKIEDIGSLMMYERSRMYELHCEALSMVIIPEH